MAELTDRQKRIANLAATWLERGKSLYGEMLRDELDAGLEYGRHAWAMPRYGTVLNFREAAKAWAALA